MRIIAFQMPHPRRRDPVVAGVLKLLRDPLPRNRLGGVVLDAEAEASRHVQSFRFRDVRGATQVRAQTGRRYRDASGCLRSRRR